MWITELCRIAIVGAVVVPVIAGAFGVQDASSVPASQTTAPMFEVASIKVNRSASPERFGGFQPGGAFRTANVPLRQIVAWAYGEAFPVADQQVVGGPGWMDSERFDVNAKAIGDPPRGELQRMVQALLAERFQMTSHTETRDLAVYALVATPQASRRNLRTSSGDDCARPGSPAPPAAGLRACGAVGFVGGRGFGRFVSLEAVARFLTPAVGRIVLDKTGLTGTYSFDLEFAPSTAGATSPDDTRPSIFTALVDELGLRLEPARAPVQVLVIDSVSRPTED